MKLIINIWHKIEIIISWILGIWLLSGLLGFWKLLPANPLWLIIKIASVILLAFVILMRAEEAENKTLKEQLVIIRNYIFGFVALLLFVIVIYLFINSTNTSCLTYPWSNCP